MNGYCSEELRKLDMVPFCYWYSIYADTTSQHFSVRCLNDERSGLRCNSFEIDAVEAEEESEAKEGAVKSPEGADTLKGSITWTVKVTCGEMLMSFECQMSQL